MRLFPRPRHLLARLSQLWADHIDPDGIQPLQAVRTTIAGIFAIVVYHALPWQQAYWVLVSTILIVQTYAGDTPAQKVLTLCITTLIACACTYLASRLDNRPLVLALFLFVSTFLCYYSYSFGNIIGNVGVFINLFCLSAGALPVDALNSGQRTLSVALGGVIALVVCLGFWPERLAGQIRQALQKILYRLGDFNYTLLERPADHLTITTRRNRFIRGMQLAQQHIPETEVQARAIVQQVEALYEILLNLHHLRYYLHQHQILRFLSRQLHSVLRRSSWLLFSAGQPLHQAQFTVDIHKFLRLLSSYETRYQRHRHRLTEEQMLAFMSYMDNIEKLKQTMLGLTELLQRKYATSGD